MFRVAFVAAPQLALFLCLTWGTSVSARTWQIRPDGSGDAPTIQAGVDSAAVGDIVELACGSYPEDAIALKSGITLRGASAPECAVIGPGTVDALLICTDVDQTTTIEAVTLDNAAAGALCTGASPLFRDCVFSQCHPGADVTGGAPVFEDCLFVDNLSDFGGALQANDATVTLTRCSFENNYALTPGWIGGYASGGGVQAVGGSLTASECVFTDNVTGGGTSSGGWGYGGAAYCTGEAYFANCVFTGNRASGISGGSGAAVFGGTSFDRCVFVANGGTPVLDGSATLSNCLLADNTGPQLGNTSVVRCTIVGSNGQGVGSTGGLTVDDSIVAFSSGPAFAGLDVVVRCSDVFDNAGGNWVNGATGQGGVNGNVSHWPLFCDPLNGNYFLSAGSVCLATNNSCGVQIGAYGQGCGPVGLEQLSWGRIKGMYR